MLHGVCYICERDTEVFLIRIHYFDNECVPVCFECVPQQKGEA
jgi:hypothetical protein